MTATEYLSGCIVLPVAEYSLDEAVIRLVNRLALTREDNRTVHLVGNGGSASIVAHAQNDLVKACGIKAQVYQDVPTLTAFANDNGYERGYSDALSIWLEEEDVVIAVSSSGASLNILDVMRVAEDTGATIITLSGFSPDNPLRVWGELNFYVPSSNYGQVELTHAALLHCLTDRLAHVR